MKQLLSSERMLVLSVSAQENREVLPVASPRPAVRAGSACCIADTVWRVEEAGVRSERHERRRDGERGGSAQFVNGPVRKSL